MKGETRIATSVTGYSVLCAIALVRIWQLNESPLALESLALVVLIGSFVLARRRFAIRTARDERRASIEDAVQSRRDARPMWILIVSDFRMWRRLLIAILVIHPERWLGVATACVVFPICGYWVGFAVAERAATT
jgi:hypothetical protein